MVYKMASNSILRSYFCKKSQFCRLISTIGKKLYYYLMMQRAGEWQSRSSNKTSPSSSTVRYLKSKISNQNRKSSIDSEGERSNFCCSIKNSNYSVDRGYINTIGEHQIQLYYTKFTPNVKIGQVCIIHSFCESSDDYLGMAEYFAERGYVVSMVDLRGFGYSGGSRVNQPAKKILTDIEALLRNFQKDLKTFIIAHGLGALFINALLQENTNLKISGVINISPLLQYSDKGESILLRRLLLKISPMIFGNVLIHNMSNVTALAKDPYAIKQKIESSSFSQSSFTLKMADQYDRISKKVKEEAYKFVYPILIVCGSKDYIQDLDQIKKYYSSLSSQDRQFKLIQGGYHQLHNDYEGDELMMRIYNWMESKKDGTKWKTPQPFAKDGVLKKSRFKFWAKFGLIISIIFTLVALIRRFKLIKLLRKSIKI